MTLTSLSERRLHPFFQFSTVESLSEERLLASCDMIAFVY